MPEPLTQETVEKSNKPRPYRHKKRRPNQDQGSVDSTTLEPVNRPQPNRQQPRGKIPALNENQSQKPRDKQRVKQGLVPQKQSIFGKVAQTIKHIILGDSDTQKPVKTQTSVQQQSKNKISKQTQTPPILPPEKAQSKMPQAILDMQAKKSIKSLVINHEALETRVAYLEDGRLEDFQIERANQQSISGAIFLGRICNLEPSLEAAFVDIGQDKNAFLHYKDIMPVTYDVAERVTRTEEAHGAHKREYNNAISKRIEAIKEARKQSSEVTEREKKRISGRITTKDIPQLFPPQSPVLVQVSKDTIGTKGARVTANISIPGRYLVLLPYSEHIGISKKIESRSERHRLRDILSSFDLPVGVGLICRTIGEGHKKEHFENDLAMLLEIWQKIETALLNPKPPVCLYREPNLLETTFRDSLTEDIDAVYIDNADAYMGLKKMVSLVGEGHHNEALKIHHHTLNEPIFTRHHITQQLEHIFTPESHLSSGSYLVIQETEALVSIDVNSGKNRKGKDLPETIFETNVEAAKEVMRQLRLRSLGGLIVVDFIDMPYDRQRQELYQIMRHLAQIDRVKTEVLPLSRFGLMEMTRQRDSKSLLNTVFHDCPYCHGRGKVRTVHSMSVEIHRRLRETLHQLGGKSPTAIRVYMHPDVLNQMKKEDANILDKLESEFKTALSFRPDETIHMEAFRLINPDNDQELKV